MASVIECDTMLEYLLQQLTVQNTQKILFVINLYFFDIVYTAQRRF